MPMTLDGSCMCGAVRFRVDSHTPVPFMRCYCTLCRKQAGGGGYAIALGALAESLEVEGREHVVTINAEIDGKTSSTDRLFCGRCGTVLWGWDPRWPELVHPVASVIDTELPQPPHSYHVMHDSRAAWVVPEVGPDDRVFPGYPDISLDDWHKQNGLWVE